MAATMKVYCDYGPVGSITSQDTTTNNPALRFKAADNNAINLNNPVRVPQSGQVNRSYWKHVYLYCAANPSQYIHNVRFLTDSANGFGAGTSLKVGDQTPTRNHASTAGYVQATGTGNTGNAIVGNHTNVTSVSDAFTKTEGSPLTVSVSETDGRIVNIGDTSDYVILQLEVADNTSPGLIPTEMFTFGYDEV
ncbi:MAG: hypothetical protein Q7T18_02815 [Sedimentisphaerales bacterium]|nr:hypothetical protein [Sedimentisphaerales bacterium]